MLATRARHAAPRSFTFAVRVSKPYNAYGGRLHTQYSKIGFTTASDLLNGQCFKLKWILEKHIFEQFIVSDGAQGFRNAKELKEFDR